MDSPAIYENRNTMIKHYASLITNPNNPRILEIGIFRGEFVDYIVNNCNFLSIDGVDLFHGITCSGDVDGNNVVNYDVGRSFTELSEKYKNRDNINFHKCPSIDFLNKSPDNYYDIIYIDGDHSYQGVKGDLMYSFNKIKNGGYIMGHDYEMNMEKARNVYYFGVKEAVTEFCTEYRQKLLAKANDGCVSFCIQIQK